jgi:hypothetical protein
MAGRWLRAISMSLLKVERYKRVWMQHPDFTKFSGEPDA